MSDHPPVPTLKATDHLVNALQAALKGIPGIGEALEHLLFGALQELRMKRVEHTLCEVLEILREKRVKVYIEGNEDFANLIEASLPPLSRATAEEKRTRFRNLLINAAQLPPGERRWDDARLVGKLLDEIDEPGLHVLNALSRCLEVKNHIDVRCQDDAIGLFERLPIPDTTKPGAVHEYNVLYVFDYDKPMISEWVIRLYEMRLIWMAGSREDLLSITRTAWGAVKLTSLGEKLIGWTIDNGDAHNFNT